MSICQSTPLLAEAMVLGRSATPEASSQDEDERAGYSGLRP